MTVLSRLPTTARLLLVLLGVGLGLNLRDIAAAIGAPIPALPIPYGGSLLDNALAVLVALLLAALLRPRWHGPAGQPGAARKRLGGPLWVLLASLPCWLGLALLGTPNTALTGLDATMLAVLFPLAEEVLFRGLGFVLLVKIVRGPWLARAAAGAVVRHGALARLRRVRRRRHRTVRRRGDRLGGSSSPGSTTSTATPCGAAWSCVSMNLAWNVFSLDDAIVGLAGHQPAHRHRPAGGRGAGLARAPPAPRRL
jgi:hypothetical protein